MVDLENTGSRGLQGVEYLTPDDSVTIFYNKECQKMEWGRVQQLME